MTKYRSDEFIRIWNLSTSLDEFLDNYPHEISRLSATAKASRLRKRGEVLRSFSPAQRGSMIRKSNFIYLWNRADSIDDFLAQYPGIKRQSAVAMASEYRAEGNHLKKFQRGGAGRGEESRLSDWYTANQVGEMFGWSSRAMVSQTARREKWAVAKVGSSNLYARVDIDEYWFARQRRELAAKIGWSAADNPLIRHDEWDIDCPVCDAFAIGFNGNWTCVNGHSAQAETPTYPVNN